MSMDWTPVELEAASQIMKASGNMSYEEFCEALDNGYFADVVECRGAADQGDGILRQHGQKNAGHYCYPCGNCHWI